MSLSEKSGNSSENWNIRGDDLLLDKSISETNNSQYQHTKDTPESIYLKKLALSIRSLESILAKEKKKRKWKTIIVVAIAILIIAMITNGISNGEELVFVIINALLYSVIYYYGSILVLHYSNKKNSEDLITIEKLKTELALLSGKKESSYHLPMYHNAIDSMEDWL